MPLDGDANLSEHVLDAADEAEACRGHANPEPPFTEAPRKMALPTPAITQTSMIGVVLAPWVCGPKMV